MADETDIINSAILKAAEVTFRASESGKRLMPNPIGQQVDTPRLTEADIKRLLER